jgi:pyruvate dehydrogenase E1 component
VPPCRAYDPAFAYEVAAIIRNGLRDMYGEVQNDVFYYVTLYNENYPMPAKPAIADLDAQIMRGLYKWADAGTATHRATLVFSGSAHSAVRAAAAELEARWDVACDLWSATSYKALRENALDVERWNRLHPTSAPRQADVTRLLADGAGPVVAVTDFMRIVPEQIARFVPNRSFVPLGTDGFGRSDTRSALRRHFEIDMPHVVVATLHALAQSGDVKPEVVADAIAHYGLDPESMNPLYA